MCNAENNAESNLAEILLGWASINFVNFIAIHLNKHMACRGGFFFSSLEYMVLLESF